MILDVINVMNEKILFFRNRIYDGIYGFAVGDALGVPIKNTNRSKLRLSPVEDMFGYGYYDAPTGTWSENTSLMLSAIDSIIENDGINYDDLIFKMYNYFEYNNHKTNYDIFKLSDANKNAIFNYKSGVTPVECGNSVSTDCSCLSRIVPLVYYLDSSDYVIDEEVSLVNDVCSISHMNEINKLGCMIFTDYTKQLLSGVDKYEALNFVRNREYNKFYSDYCISLYDRILSEDFSKIEMYGIKSDDGIVNTLEASLWSFLNGKNYEECLVKAINLGNNTDMIGAITGLWCGIFFGNQYMPQRWYNKLKGKEILNNMSVDFNAILNDKDKGRSR